MQYTLAESRLNSRYNKYFILALSMFGTEPVSITRFVVRYDVRKYAQCVRDEVSIALLSRYAA